MHGQLLLAALVPVALAEYSYSYVAAPTGTPTASAAPTRTDVRPDAHDGGVVLRADDGHVRAHLWLVPVARLQRRSGQVPSGLDQPATL